MKSDKPKTRRPRAGKTAGTRSLRPAGAEAARLRVARRRRSLAKAGQGAAPEQAAEAVRDDAVTAANSNEGAGAKAAGNSEVASAAEGASRGSESEGTERDDTAAGKSAAKDRSSENTAARDAAPETGSAGEADPDEREGARPKRKRASRRQTAKTISEGAAGADAAGTDQGSSTSSGRKGRDRGRKQAEEKTEPAEAKSRAEKSHVGGKNLADQPGQTDKPQQMLGRGRRSKAPTAAVTEPVKPAGDRRRSAPKPGVGAAVAQGGPDREPVQRASRTWNAAPPAVAGRGESRATAPSGSWPLDASSEAAALMRDALELGAEAMREVVAARTLPEVFEAQMRYGRAASEIWMRQVQIASSLLRPSLGSWWVSPDVMGARLPE